ncbi:MAG: transposase [Candidatus Beckwithbacteria bacterium]
MPGRETPLITGEIYHIINRGVTAQTIFSCQRHYQRALEIMLYYQNQNPHLRYSYFSALTFSAKTEKLNQLRKNNELLVEIFAYCFMPNHFHFLLKQLVDNGISNFLSKFSNSYTRYFNTKHNRIGPLFQGKFKSVRIESEQQLLHVSRYIHLNPYSSGVIKSKHDLYQYQYSSLPEYLSLTKKSFCQKDIILNYFKKSGTYQNFIFDQADYQRELEVIKHLVLETE